MIDSIRELIERTKAPSFLKRKERRRLHDLVKRRQRGRLTSKTRQQNLHPSRVGARSAVAWAIKRGELVKPETCAMAHTNACDGPIKAWHWRGFDRAHQLDVQWLCQRHYAQAAGRTPSPIP